MPAYSLAELSQLANVTPRTVRYYIQQGLLPSPGTMGPGTRYGDAHLARIRLIRQLQRQHLPLAEIRARLAALGDEEVQSALEGDASRATGSAVDYVRSVLTSRGLPTVHPTARPAMSPPPTDASAALASRHLAVPERSSDHFEPTPSASVPTRSQWDRIALGPDVELHVRRPLSRHQNRQVDRLVAIARQLLEEDQ